MGKREQFLFEHYRQNLNRLLEADSRLKIHPDRDDIVICPLCFDKYFTLEDIENGSLTAEHVPPHKLGGKVDMLTCRDCNNNQGASLDSHLIEYIRSLDALHGTGPTFVDGIASGEDTGEFRVEFRTVADQRWELLGVPKASNPKHIDNFTKGFLSRDFRFNLKLLLPNPSRGRLGLIRAAYLIAFRYLGYGFLVNMNLGVLRYQFRNPQEDVYPIQSVLFPFDQPDDFLGINVISSPSNMKCYFVVFDVQAEKGLARRAGVMLPGPNGRDSQMFKDMESFNGTTITINHFDIDFSDKLEMPRLAHAIWNTVGTTDS